MVTDIGIYKFASGPMKDKPLDEKGLTWEIASIGNKTVAAFSDGTYTDFYISIPNTPPEKPDWNKLQKMILEKMAPDLPDEDNPEILEAMKERLRETVCFTTREVPEKVESTACREIPISYGTTRPVDPKPPVRFRKQLPPGFYDRASKVKQPYSQFATIICRYKTIVGSNPTHSGEPVFGIYSQESRVLVCTYDRATVGKGVREFLWLYQKLREYDRGHWAAFREAWQVYFL